jgi:hypothetical protein
VHHDGNKSIAPTNCPCEPTTTYWTSRQRLWHNIPPQLHRMRSVAVIRSNDGQHFHKNKLRSATYGVWQDFCSRGYSIK